jgi:uncharacterized protein YrrD
MAIVQNLQAKSRTTSFLLSQQQHLFHHQKSKFEFQHIESINSKPIIIPAIAPSSFSYQNPKNDRWE